MVECGVLVPVAEFGCAGGIVRGTALLKRHQVSIRKFGDSYAVVIPRSILKRLGLNSQTGAELAIEDDSLTLRRPARRVRSGWAEAAQKIAEAGDDQVRMGEFGNAGDSELFW